MAGRFWRRLLNLNSHNHNQRDRRRRFYLAVLIECLASTPYYDIPLLRKRASHVSAHAISPHAESLTVRRSKATEPSRARCKQRARPAMRMTNGRHCKRRRPHDSPSSGCRLHVRSSSNKGLKSNIAPCRFCASRIKFATQRSRNAKCSIWVPRARGRVDFDNSICF